MKPDELPVITKTPDCPLDDLVVTHPAYAQIGASRWTSGHGHLLYGSDARHRNGIRISIKTSKQSRGLSSDRYSAGRMIVDVDLSEAQWATFISTLNVGDGSPCTLNWSQATGSVAGIAALPFTSRQEQFSGEMEQRLERAVKSIEELQVMVDEKKLNTKSVQSLICQIRNNIKPNIAFVAQQFEEHMEAVSEQAKIETEAYITGAIQRAGIATLRDRVTTLEPQPPSDEREKKES